MRWPWRRKQDDMSVESLLARAEVASPTRTTPPAPAPAPAGPADASFRIRIEDVFSITGRGVVVTGRIDAGTIAVGQQVQQLRDGQPLRAVTVTGIEEFRKTLTTAGAAMNVGLLLAGVDRTDVVGGDVLAG